MKTVLVVEDDGQFRDSLVAALSDDYLVWGFDGGRKAIDFLRRYPVDVVLLDMVLADGDGFTVLGALAALDRKPHVVILTVLDQVAKAVKVMRIGASDYLVKPCGLNTVRKAIQKVVENKPTNMNIAHARAGVQTSN